MSTPNTPPQIPNMLPQPEQDLDSRDRLAMIAAGTLMASLLASGAASVGATIAANRGEQAPSPDPEIEQTIPLGNNIVTQSIDAGMQDVVPGGVTLRLPGIRKDISITAPKESNINPLYEAITSNEEVTQTVERKAQLMKWARLFDTDPAARETLDAELGVEDASATIKQLLRDGWTVEGIALHGYASDEDDTAWKNGGDNPGFGIDDEKNVRLAEKRAEAVSELLEDKLAADISPDIAKMVQVTGGTEMRDDALAEAVTALAKRRGVSAQQLVVRYNRDRDSFSDSDLRILDGLREDRYVSIEITVSKDVVRTGYALEEGSLTESSQESKDISVVLIPIIIPFIPRRGKEPEVPDVPPVIVPPRPVSKHPTSRPQRGPKSIGNPRLGFIQPAYAHKQPTTHNTSFGNNGRNRGVPVHRKGRGRP